MRRVNLTRLIVSVAITLLVILIWWLKWDLLDEDYIWAIVFLVYCLLSLYIRFFVWFKNNDAPVWLAIVIPAVLSFFIAAGPAVLIGELFPEDLDELPMAMTMFVISLIIMFLDILGVVRESKQIEQFKQFEQYARDSEQQTEYTYGYQKSAYEHQQAEYSSENNELQRALDVFLLDSLSDVTLKELQTQRNRLLKEFHPDNGSDADNKRAQKINNAYEILKKYL